MGKDKKQMSLYLLEDEKEYLKKFAYYREPLSRTIIRLAIERAKQLELSLFEDDKPIVKED